MTRFFLLCLLLNAPCIAMRWCDYVLVEGKVSYYRPNDSALREIYGSSWLNGQGEITAKIWGDAYTLNAYGSVNYLKSKGLSVSDECRTTIEILPASLGFKYRACVKGERHRLDVYAAGGLRYFFVWVENKDPYVTRKVDKNGAGWVVEGGLLYFLSDFYCIDLFVDYCKKTFSFASSHPLVEGHRIDVGGVSIGGGIGLQF